jgi:hypothetical protein
MPFTPFHLGPGLLVKAAFPKRMSFTAFAATQVCVDVETLYHIVRKDWPVHRQLHSVVGGSVVGLLVAGAVVLGRPVLNRAAAALFPGNANLAPGISAESSGVAAVIGGLLGGTSHSVLDAIVHPDVNPLWPLSESHGLYRLVSAESLQLLCVVAGVMGLAWLWLQPRRWRPVV